MLIYCSPEDSKHLYPANNTGDFIVELPHAVSGKYIQVEQVYFTGGGTKRLCFVLCDQIQPSILAARQLPVLCSFFQRGPVIPIQSIPLITKHFHRIHIRIVGEDLKTPASFSKVCLTLKVL